MTISFPKTKYPEKTAASSENSGKNLVKERKNVWKYTADLCKIFDLFEKELCTEPLGHTGLFLPVFEKRLFISAEIL